MTTIILGDIMKAIVYEKYGPPDVLKLTDVEKPTPKDDEVLIKVHSTAINPFEWHFMRGEPVFMRLGSGILHPKEKILGCDLSGTVEAIGKNVTEFKLGDAVFGLSDFGALADYVCAPEKTLVHKPENTSFEEAASIPIAALTALQSLRDLGKIKSGQKILINGSSGGVGTFSVQIAKSFDTHVTGVCSTRNLDLVRGIGADHVIDYTEEDFTQTGERFDLMLDNVGNCSVSDYKCLLKSPGICIVNGFTTAARMIAVMIRGAWTSRTSTQKIHIMMANPTKEDLLYLKELLEQGKVKPVIDRCYPLNETAEAMDYLEQGHAQGKVVITMDHEERNDARGAYSR